ncbi:hypothetical protein P692DRAFT_201874506 [Suillus brevipes Sb2]|nr:hypothetical protein P692DRAFT_201874506 [Suillus brevipes Sb2]
MFNVGPAEGGQFDVRPEDVALGAKEETEALSRILPQWFVIVSVVSVNDDDEKIRLNRGAPQPGKNEPALSLALVRLLDAGGKSRDASEEESETAPYYLSRQEGACTPAYIAIICDANLAALLIVRDGAGMDRLYSFLAVLFVQTRMS